MKIILTLAALMLATTSSAQVAVPTKFELIPAVRTTVEISGESYIIARDENDKIIFVKTQTKNTVVKPMLINITEPKK